jgi:Tol biopolymer transport system component
MLPGKRAILFAAGPAATANEWNSAHVVVQSLETGVRRVVAARGTMPMYAAGYLIYLAGHSLVAQRFDLERLDVEGPVFTVLDDVERTVPGGGWFSVSGDAVLLHVRGPALEPNKLAWVSPGGQLSPLSIPPGLYNRPTLSPDGQRIVVAVSDPDSDIWTFDVASGGSTRITNDGTNLWPLWTPDGTRIVYSSTRINAQGGVNLYQSRSDSTGNEELLLSSGTTNRAESWVPGGGLAFMQLSLETGADLLAVHPGAQPTVLKRSRFEESAARFSPDGRWMAYLASETGRPELYVQPFPLGSGEPVQISSTGAQSVLWSKDGRELFFSRGNELWATQAPRRPGEAFGEARLLTSGPFILDTGFDVAADGRFLVVTNEKDRPVPVQIDFTLNWTASIQTLPGQQR